MDIDVVDKTNSQVDEVDLPDQLFDVEVREHLFWEVVRWQQTKRRAGTHSTKNRSAVRGGGSKPWQQKGTGRARHGSIRSPIWVGGGIAHGPSPKDYDYNLPKSKKLAALRAAVSMKAQENEFFVVEDFDFPKVKTKLAVEMLESFGTESALLVDSTEETESGDVKHNDVLRLSIRNLPDVKYLAPAGLNVEDILNHDILLVSQSAVSQVEERLSNE